MKPAVTLVVVPRERFSYAQKSLEDIYANTDYPFELVYVDGRSPSQVRRYLERAAREKGFRLIREERYLSPNQARNIGLAAVDTPYVVFLDNDVMVTPGWLAALMQAAERSGAWIVGPTILQGDPAAREIHMAGGIAHITEENGRRVFYERHLFSRQHLPKVAEQLKEGPVELLEFHCLLARTDIFDRLGPLDEELLSCNEHIDLSMAVREAGGTVYYEPSSIITYVMPPPFALSDLPYFMVRWSDDWNRRSLQRFRERWNLPADDKYTGNIGIWAERHRRLPFRTFLRRYRRVLRGGDESGLWLVRLVEKYFQPATGDREAARPLDYAAKADQRSG